MALGVPIWGESAKTSRHELEKLDYNVLLARVNDAKLSAEERMARLRALRQAGCIVVAATHDLDLADGLFDRAIFLRDGRIVDDIAAPRGLRAAYAERLGR